MESAPTKPGAGLSTGARLLFGLAAAWLAAMASFSWSTASIESTLRCADGTCVIDEAQPLRPAVHHEVPVAAIDHVSHVDMSLGRNSYQRLILESSRVDDQQVGCADGPTIFAEIDALDAYLHAPTGVHLFHTSASNPGSRVGSLVFAAIAVALLVIALRGRRVVPYR